LTHGREPSTISLKRLRLSAGEDPLKLITPLDVPLVFEAEFDMEEYKALYCDLVCLPNILFWIPNFRCTPVSSRRYNIQIYDLDETAAMAFLPLFQEVLQLMCGATTLVSEPMNLLCELYFATRWYHATADTLQKFLR
jgi:hypothetical protein